MTNALVPVGGKKYGELVAIMEKKPHKSWKKTLLSIQTQTKALFEDLSKYTKLTGSFGVDLYRYIWTFLPREDTTVLPLLCGSIAVSLHKNSALAVDIIRRSSAGYPLTFKEYLFCKRYGKTESIAHLRICNEFPTSDAEIQEIFKELPNLKTIEFFDVGVEMMKKVAPYCTRVTHLSFLQANLVNEGLQALAPYCGNVTHLSLSQTCIDSVSAGCFYSSKGLHALASSCKKLSHFYFAESLSLSAYPHDVALICTELKDVSLIDCVTNQTLRNLAPYCKNWTHLRIKAVHVNDVGLKEIAPHLEHLTHLTLERVNIEAEGLQVLESCKNLTEVTFHVESGFGLESLMKDLLAFISRSRLKIHLSFGEIKEDDPELMELLSNPKVRVVEKISLGSGFYKLVFESG